eukprot:SAG31_NODE_39991_length_284_cov_0.724324_1_plen_59_part_10
MHPTTMQVQSVIDDAWEEQSDSGELGAFDNILLSVQTRADGSQQIVSKVDRVLEGSSGS